MCDYTGSHFGASYPDACCIDGYLWDLDSCDEPGGGLSSGGDDPCPQCNTTEWLKRVKEEVHEMGWCAGYEGEPLSDNPFLTRKAFVPEYTGELLNTWNAGHAEGVAEEKTDMANGGKPL